MRLSATAFLFLCTSSAVAQTSASHSVTIILPRFTSVVSVHATSGEVGGTSQFVVYSNQQPGNVVVSDVTEMDRGISKRTYDTGDAGWSRIRKTIEQRAFLVTGLGPGFLEPSPDSEKRTSVVTVTD